MFDRHIHRHGPESIDVRQTITEQRAPTDESVRLLKEMEQAAQAKVNQSVRLEGNGFNGVVHFITHPMDMDVSLICLYDWNGKRRTVTYRTSDLNIHGKNDKVELMMGLRDELAKDIASAVLDSAFRAIDWSGR